MTRRVGSTEAYWAGFAVAPALPAVMPYEDIGRELGISTAQARYETLVALGRLVLACREKVNAPTDKTLRHSPANRPTQHGRN